MLNSYGFFCVADTVSSKTPRVVPFSLVVIRMAERQLSDQQQPPADAQLQSPLPGEDMIACVMALEAALLPCLPARELQAIDRSPHPSHQSKHLSLSSIYIIFLVHKLCLVKCFHGD